MCGWGGVEGGWLKAFHCTNFILGPDIIPIYYFSTPMKVACNVILFNCDFGHRPITHITYLHTIIYNIYANV